MSASLYDKAILDKIKYWVKDSNITITSPNETNRLFRYNADINNDEPIKLPLISLRRDPRMEILDVNKQPASYLGWKKEITVDDKLNGRISHLMKIPVRLSYQLDIYTRYYEDAEEYVRNFIFNFINYPKVTIKIPYNGLNMPYYVFIDLNNEVTDNSDIPERLIEDSFCRKTLSFTVNAMLFDYKTDNGIRFNEDIEVEIKSSKDDDKIRRN